MLKGNIPLDADFFKKPTAKELKAKIKGVKTGDELEVKFTESPPIEPVIKKAAIE